MTLSSRLQGTLICHENYLFFYYILTRTCNAFALQFVIKYYELSGMLPFKLSYLTLLNKASQFLLSYEATSFFVTNWDELRSNL